MYGWPFFDESHFKHIDGHALQAPTDNQISIPSLAQYLGSPFRTELEKARVIYTWVTHNVIYDIDSFFKGKHYPSMEPKDVLLRGSAVCAGYAKLYKEFADRLGLESRIISGYAKGYGWNGDVPSEKNHDWNAVKIDDRWYFIDTTWGAGHVKGREFIRKFKNIYFLCPEDVFFYEHYPEDENWLPDIWKNKSPLAGLTRWANLLKFEEDFLLLGLSQAKFSQFECFTNLTTSDSVIDIFFDKTIRDFKCLSFKYHLCDPDGKEIPNTVMILDGNSTIKISVFFPSQGTYKLDIYGKVAEKEGSYNKLITLKIMNTGEGKENTYPKLYPIFYERKGTSIYSPSNGPLKDHKNIITDEIFFDLKLPGAIKAAINPGWNYLNKREDEDCRWQGNAKIQAGDTKISVKYKEGESFKTIAEWK